MVNNLLVNSASLFSRVTLLEDVIYDQACRLFGVFSRKPKNLCGHNRRAQQSIKLVMERDLLLRQIELSSDKTVKDSLQSLCDIMQSRLSRRSETSRKRRWKIKQANEAFLKNPYEAGKSALDPKCEVRFKCEKSSLDHFKIQFLSDAFCDVHYLLYMLFPLLFLFLKILIVPVLKQKILPLFYTPEEMVLHLVST